MTGEMGWSTYRERIDITKLVFRLRIESSNENTWMKKKYGTGERREDKQLGVAINRRK